MDAQSFFVSVALAYGSLAVLLVLSDRPSLRSPVGALVAAYAFIAIGVLLQAMSGVLPFWAHAVLGNLLAWLGLLHQGWAILHLSGRRLHWRAVVGADIALLVVVVVLSAVPSQVAFATANLLYAALFAFSAWALASWTGAPATLRGVTAGLFTASAVLYGVRVVEFARGALPPSFDRSNVPLTLAVLYPLIFTTLISGAFSLLLLIRRLLEDRLRDASEQLARLAAYDSLTGLPNRHTLLERAVTEASRADRSGRPLSLAVLDLDRLKLINDGHGHRAGDEALRRVSQACRSSFRDVDTAARIGGDEFAVLLPDSDLSQAQAAMARMLTALQDAPLVEDGYRVELSASVGVAQYDPPEPLDELLARADRAMYSSKNAGGGTVSAGEALPLSTPDPPDAPTRPS